MLKNTRKATGRKICYPNQNQKLDFISKEFYLMKTLNFIIAFSKIDLPSSPPSNYLFIS